MPHWGAGNAVGGRENAVEQEGASHLAFMQNQLFCGLFVSVRFYQIFKRER